MKRMNENEITSEQIDQMYEEIEMGIYSNDSYNHIEDHQNNKERYNMNNPDSRVVFEEVKVFLEHMMCECGGEFKRGNDLTVLTTCPPQYSHKCDKCGKVKTFHTIYPNLTYRSK